MNIDEIKKLLAAGDVAGAEAAAKAALENDPDNVRLLIVFGTCRQLQGDEEAFLGTYELVRAALDEKKIELDATAAEEWKRFKALHERIAQPELLQKGDPPRKSNLMEYVLIAVLIAAGSAVAVWYLGREVQREFVELHQIVERPLVDVRPSCVCCAACEPDRVPEAAYKKTFVTEIENRIK